MTARKDFLQSLTLGKKSEPTAEYAPSLRSPWRASNDWASMMKFPLHHTRTQLTTGRRLTSL
ncbi:hypothetical protein [Candidiatus Paracoxiella cheracis]|uniref:hypothetical protein n=1 Tax=Candidiatus Paracoxiella cheracis TaxID=3405120 RepID=UPI003BF47430